MADMVTSAIVQETVGEILCNLKEKYKGKSNSQEHIERLEMAQIKPEAALDTTDVWNITSTPLLRWRGKLKRAAQECDDTLRKCKQRVQEEAEDMVRMSSSLPSRISHRAKSLVSSIFNLGSDELNNRSAAVRRFEWFADGASEFVRFVELGGAPRRYMFFDPLVRHLLEGKTIEYKLVLGNQHHMFYLRPFSTPERGTECRLLYVLKDYDAPENSFLLAISLRISESTNILGVAVRCLQLLSPHFRSTAETVKTKLTQLPTHDFCWVPYVDSSHKQHWNNVHAILSKWFRPNPHCCCQQQHDQYEQAYTGSSNKDSSSESSLQCDTYLEPVIKVYLQGYVPLSSASNKNKGSPYLKLTLLFSPHASSPSMSAGGSATEMVVRGQQQQENDGMYANISFEQLDEIMLPKAVDCFRRDTGATEYRMLWRSRHGAAYIQVEKCAPRGVFWRDRAGHGLRRQEKVERWTHAVTDFLGSWVALAPPQLQGPIADWIQKQKEMQLAPAKV